MQGTASTLHFSDYQGQAHKIACSKGGQQGDAFETVRFAVTKPDAIYPTLHPQSSFDTTPVMLDVEKEGQSKHFIVL